MKKVLKRNSFVVIAFALVLIATLISGCIQKDVNKADTTTTNANTKQCTLSVDYKTVLNKKDEFNKDKLSVLNDSGIVIAETTVNFTEGESIIDIVKREFQNKKIHIEFETSPVYNTTYVKGLSNIYAGDCGTMSGWLYAVNGTSPSKAMSDVKAKEGDKIEIRFSCDGGTDVGFAFESN